MTAAALLDRLAPPVDGSNSAEARAWLDRHGLPTTRLENWRHTPVDDIVTALLETQTGPDVGSSVESAQLDDLVPDLGGPRIVHVNGLFAAHLSRSDERVRHTSGRPEGAAANGEPLDGFEALNRIIDSDPIELTIDDRTTATDAEHPLQIIHLTVPGDSPTGSHPRTVIRVGEGSQLHVVEHHAAIGGESVTNAFTHFIVEAEATLEHRRIVRGTDESIHVGRLDIDQHADSTVRTTAVAVGGAIVRTAINPTLLGDRARIDLDGLSVPVERQRHDIVLTVDHAASHGYSSQDFRGIMADSARGNFMGHVIVREGTVANDARQSNPNLILSRRAQAYTNPWIEIYADDVACTHGATVGRLDEESLFYLRSRGIPEDEARALLVAAFAGDIADHVEPAALRDHLDRLLSDRTPGGPIREP